MTEILFECRNCRKEWPRSCRCEDAYPKTRPLTHALRPADPAALVRTEFTYRGPLYRATGWYAEGDWSQWAPTPGAVEVWKAIDGSLTSVLVEAPSFGLTKRAVAFLWIAFDVEMRRRNDARDAAFARRAEER